MEFAAFTLRESERMFIRAMLAANYTSVKHCVKQCDQVGRFFAFWATIQSWWQQLFYPNHPRCKAIFVKVSKPFIFLVKSISDNFYRHLENFYWSHWCKATLNFFYSWRLSIIADTRLGIHAIKPKVYLFTILP